MEKLNDFMSISDVLRLGAYRRDYPIALPAMVLKHAFCEKSQYIVFQRKLQNLCHEQIESQLIGFPKSFHQIDFELEIRVDDQTGTAYFCLDFMRFMFSTLSLYADRNLFAELSPEKISSFRDLPDEILKEHFIQKINNIKKQYRILSKEKRLTVEAREQLLENQTQLLWLKKNYDLITQTFSQPLSVELFSDMNIDRLLLLLASDTSSFLRKEDLSEEQKLVALSYLEHYLLISEFMNQKGECSYQEKITFTASTGKNYVLSNHDLQEYVEYLYRLYPEWQNREDRLTSWKILFRRFLWDARRNLNSSDLAEKLHVHWKLLPKGEMIKSNLGTHTEVSQEKAVTTVDPQGLFWEKKQFFDQSNYVAQLEGIHTFQGYLGFLYPNRKVVMEQFYEMKKEELVPTVYKALYVMDFEDFVEMSRYSKSELIEMIRSHQNRSVKRIYHTEYWQDRVTKEIQSIDYTAQDFIEIEEIISSLKNISLVEKDEGYQKIKR